MKAIVGERSNLWETGLEVVRQLEWILTIPSDILMVSYERYNRYLTLSGKITFNVKNFLV